MNEENLSKGHSRDMTSPCWEALVSSKTVREKLGLGESAFHALLRRGLPRYQLNRRLLRFRHGRALGLVDPWSTRPSTKKTKLRVILAHNRSEC